MLTPAKKEFIEFMMSADVLRFGQFVTKSGRHTPYFVNTATTAPAARSPSWVTSMLHWSRKPAATISTPCSARPIRAFLW